jgi:CTP synthase
MKPSPPYLGLLLASTGKMQDYRSRGYRMSPHLSYSEGNDSSDDDDEISRISA